MVEQENRDLLVRLLADIHCPMNADTRFFPIDLSGRDFNALALTSVVSTGRFDASLRRGTQSRGDRLATPRLPADMDRNATA